MPFNSSMGVNLNYFSLKIFTIYCCNQRLFNSNDKPKKTNGMKTSKKTG